MKENANIESPVAFGADGDIIETENRLGLTKESNIVNDSGILNRISGTSASSVVDRSTVEKSQKVSNDLSSSLEVRINSCNSNKETTREMIEQVIDIPKCDDKLLSKPPFRFLYDLVLAIKNATGFGEDIFR